jgi:esterase/lipase
MCIQFLLFLFLLLNILLDISVLPLALISTLVYYFFAKQFQTKYKNDKKCVLLVHGSGFNQSQWALGYFMLRKKYNVYALNYAGLVSNGHHEDVAFYASTKLRNKILKIKRETGIKEIILIGHSMGGLCTSYYAEKLAMEDEINITKNIPICCPFQGASPIIKMIVWFGGLQNKRMPARYLDMSAGSDLLKELNQLIKTTQTHYECISTEGDMLVRPSCAVPEGFVENEKIKHRNFTWGGHYLIMLSPQLWNHILQVLDDAK